MPQNKNRDCCGDEECDRPICEECDEGCIGSAYCYRCDTDFCTECEVGGDDDTPEQEWVCDACLEEISEQKEESICWRVYDCEWFLDKTGEVSSENVNEEVFDILEEAQASYKERCTVQYCGVEIHSIYLEECEIDEDDETIPTDTIDCWERISVEEFKRSKAKKKHKKKPPITDW